jgi:hypothetical protein
MATEPETLPGDEATHNEMTLACTHGVDDSLRHQHRANNGIMAVAATRLYSPPTYRTHTYTNLSPKTCRKWPLATHCPTRWSYLTHNLAPISIKMWCLGFNARLIA